MAIKKRASKKKVAKKKVVASKGTNIVASLREQLKAAKDEARELNKSVKAGERKVAALLKLLESSQADVNRFLTSRVKEAAAKYAISLAPKKPRRKAKKKVAVQQ